jgi:transposase
VAAAKAGDDPRPRRQAPYMVAAAILDERADAETLTSAQLVEAMAEQGVTISQSTAQALLRELRSPLSTRLSNRRPGRPAGEPRPTGTGTGGGPAARPRQ